MEINLPTIHIDNDDILEYAVIKDPYTFGYGENMYEAIQTLIEILHNTYEYYKYTDNKLSKQAIDDFEKLKEMFNES